MPLRLSVGFSRKAGEANFSSRGASVNLELEVDTALVAEPGRLQERIRELFGLAQQSVNEELHGASGPAPASPPANSGNGNGAGDNNRRHAPPRSTANGNGHSRGQQRGSTAPPATVSQVRALNAISERQRLDLVGLVRDQYGVGDPAALTIAQASELIDLLNRNNTATAGGRRDDFALARISR